MLNDRWDYDVEARRLEEKTDYEIKRYERATGNFEGIKTVHDLALAIATTGGIILLGARMFAPQISQAINFLKYLR